MSQNSGGGLFRARNILGAALIGGIGLGIYLGQIKGFGLGGSGAWGIGGKTNGETQVSTQDSGQSTPSLDTDAPNDDVPIPVPNVVKVVIDDHTYFLRQSKEDVSITLPKLIKLVKQAPGDADGFQIRIYERSTARASAEEKLKEALAAAGIPDTAVFWVPNPVN